MDYFNQWILTRVKDLYLFVRPTREFFTHGDVTHGGLQRGTYDHWAVRVFSVPHLLWHRASVYTDHLRWPVTLTPIAERLSVELLLPVFTTWVCRGWEFEHQTFRLRGTRSKQLRHHRGLKDPYQDSEQHSTKKKTYSSWFFKNKSRKPQSELVLKKKEKIYF